MPVDQYVGGIEHAILHLLYARFVCRVLKDMGLVDIEEPFARLFNQGMITKLNPATGKIEKMSKSRGNTVSPDELIARFGADTVRVYTLFIGPPEKESEWSEDGVSRRVAVPAAASTTLCGQRGRRRRADGAGGRRRSAPRWSTARSSASRRTRDRFHFHTAVAALMEFQRAIADAVEAGRRPPGAPRARGPDAPRSCSTRWRRT